MNDGTDPLVLDLTARLDLVQHEDAARARVMRNRRLIVLALVLVTYAVVLVTLARILATNGWTTIDLGLFVAFAISTPWTILGFCNAMIGLVLVHGTRDALAHAAPFLNRVASDDAVHARTAVVMTLRNEPPARAFARLRIIKTSLDATGHGGSFDYFVLSDTSRPDVAEDEEREFAALSIEAPGGWHYRRRELNTGYKAGNIRDFCERWGSAYEFMLPLDADSLMSGDAILRLVRVAQAQPKLGILQSLVVGTPAASGFARLFQFGMRHGMRSYTLGSAWWQGDCGPYWGHNALVRIKPFADHCALPILPGAPPLGGHVLSHDQIEAVMMRRAGFEVRVLPEEGGSWEDNPPTLMDFTQRDLRWCQGNMQYFRLIGLKGLLPTGRVQIGLAILMYLGAAAWMAFILLGAAKAFEVAQDGDVFPVETGIALFAVMYTMSLAPKIAGLLDVLLRPSERARYGGTASILAGAGVEFLFTTLLAPVASMRVTIFMGGLLFGRAVIWDGQQRDGYRLAWRDAARGLWPQTLAGLLLALAIGWAQPAALAWAAPVLVAFILAIPFAVISASPAFGAWCLKRGLCRIPEEISVPAEIAALTEPALPDTAAQAA
jgi:membrane glycosyltransferase